jgi:hypothetical protein
MSSTLWSISQYRSGPTYGGHSVSDTSEFGDYKRGTQFMTDGSEENRNYIANPVAQSRAFPQTSDTTRH